MDSLLKKQFALDELMPLIRERLAAGQNIRIYPNGTSMLPMIRQGVDSVVLSPVPCQLRKYDLPLYQRDNGQYVLHRIVEAGETYTCIGDSQYAVEKGVCREWMIGIAIGVYRKGKFISVDTFGYKMYARLRHWTRPIRHAGFLIGRIFRGLKRRVK